MSVRPNLSFVLLTILASVGIAQPPAEAKQPPKPVMSLNLVAWGELVEAPKPLAAVPEELSDLIVLLPDD